MTNLNFDLIGSRNLELEKQNICDLLLPVLQATDAYKDLIALQYEKTQTETLAIGFQEIETQEMVIAKFKNGYARLINVSRSSDKALIEDIVLTLGGYKDEIF